jgi:3-oxoacyl-[acyl-carrier-protein] synthase III
MFVDMILAVTKHAVSLGDFGVTLLSLHVRQAKMLCDAKQVSPGDIDAIVAAAIGRTLRAVVQHV